MLTESFCSFSKFFNITWKPASAPPLPTLAKTKKKPFDLIYDLYKMKQFHRLLCVEKNCDWSRKFTPLSYLTSVASSGIKTYSESRIELRNLQILKKILEKSSQFLSSEQPCKPKSFDVALKIAGVVKVPSENLWLRSTWRPFDSSFEWIERSVIDGGDFWSSLVGDLKSVWYSVGDAFELPYCWPWAAVTYT